MNCLASVKTRRALLQTNYAKNGLVRLRTSRLPRSNRRPQLRTSVTTIPKQASLRLMTPGQFTKAILVVGASMGIGDYICQSLSSKSVTNNLERSATMVFIGTCVTGPLSQSFQIFLERSIPGSKPSSIIKKVGLSSIWAFIVSIPLLFTATTLLQKNINGKRGTFSDALSKIERDLLPTFAVGSLYWPFFNILVFKFVKLQHRAIVGSLIGTIWNVYLSAIANEHS